MPLMYKVDVISALKEKGYSTYKMRKEKLLGEKTIQNLREQKPINWETIETICNLLQCQPGDIIEYTDE